MKFVIIALVTLASYSCGTSTEESQIAPLLTLPEQTNQITESTTPQPSFTAKPEATEPIPGSATLFPEKTPSGVPSNAILSIDGPWVIFPEDSGLWAVNNDGTCLVRLVEFPEFLIYGFSYSVSPTGGMIAFSGPVEEYFGDQPFEPDLQSSPHLYLLNLPEPDPIPITVLMEPIQIQSIATDYPGPDETTFEESSFFRIEQIKAALARPNSVAWSPSGDQLAFVAALDGPTTDLYVLDVDKGIIRRLSSGLTQAVDIEWSRDGRYIVHKAVSDINIGRSGPMLIIEGIWSAATDGSSLTLLMDGESEVVGWISDFELLLHKWDWDCWRYQLSSVDIRTGISKILWRGPFEYAVSDPVSGRVLIGHGYSESASFPGSICPVEYHSGLYLLSGDGTTERVGNWEPFKDHPPFSWSSEWNSFIYKQEGEVRYLSPGGEDSVPPSTSSIPPLISPSGQLLAERQGTTIRILGEGMEDVYVGGSFCNVLWGADDQTLFLSDDENLYIAHAPDYHPTMVANTFSGLCDSSPALVQP
jgi:hypothetical protein